MAHNYVVVDGSNIATEGRSLPSLRQLDEAVRAFLAEHPADQLTVVVDATFGHRIDPSERPEYEAAVLAGELVSPPAGAIGRGDAFILQVADKANAMILSNDSFQEFHGQYTWLFDEGRLIGGKPVPGLGWVFLLRTPVRGPASRRSVKEARSGGRSSAGSGSTRSGRSRSSGEATSKGSGRGRSERSSAPTSGDSGGRRRRTTAPSGDQLNDLLPFVDFVGSHPVGSTVDGEVIIFSSHGAYAMVDGVRCYVPLKAMGDPPPARARDVLSIGDVYPFTVASIDAPHRGIDLSFVPGTKGKPKVVSHQLPKGVPIGTAARVLRDDATNKTTNSSLRTDTHLPADHSAKEAPVSPTKKAPARKKAAAKKAPARKSAAKKAPARKTAAKKAPARKKAAAKRAPARKTAAKKAPARKKAAAKKAPARKTAAKKAPARKKAAAKKAPARRKAAAKKAPARKKAAAKRPARKTAAKKAPARKKAAAKKAPARRKAAARKAPARKTAARKAPARRR